MLLLIRSFNGRRGSCSEDSLKFAALWPDKQPNAAPNEYLTDPGRVATDVSKTAAAQKKVSKPAKSGCYSRVKERS